MTTMAAKIKHKHRLQFASSVKDPSCAKRPACFVVLGTVRPLVARSAKKPIVIGERRHCDRQVRGSMKGEHQDNTEFNASQEDTIRKIVKSKASEVKRRRNQPFKRTIKADNMCNPPSGHEVCDDVDADTMCNPTIGPWSVQSPKREKAGSRRLDSRYRANPATKPTVRQPTGPDE